MNGQAIGILGPTASGKSALAMALARRYDGEIVSCDSMQVYRGLDIGTAKPAVAEQEEIPHHLVDILDIREPFDVERFVELTEAAILDILARGKLPIVCGGTGFYARALFYGTKMPPQDAEIRQQVEAELEERGQEALQKELQAIDPESAERVGDHARRLVRALEIVRLTGKPVPQLEATPPPYAGKQFILIPDAVASRRRIEARTRQMLEDGWIAETAALVDAGLLETPTARQALGYPEIAEWLADGGGNREELVETLVVRTARYAKRQRTWFRHQHEGATLIELEGDYSIEQLLTYVSQDGAG